LLLTVMCNCKPPAITHCEIVPAFFLGCHVASAKAVSQAGLILTFRFDPCCTTGARMDTEAQNPFAFEGAK
jgi:hypothetical protein